MGLLQNLELEHLRAVSLKSIADQLTEAYQKIAALQRDIENIHAELSDKVSLVSRADESFASFAEIGQGTVSANGVTVTGAGTRFKSQAPIGSQIRIGSDRKSTRLNSSHPSRSRMPSSA